MTSSSEFGSLNYEILGIIGKGGTSTVYKIRKCDDDSVYAMKEIEVDQLSSSQVVSIQAEIRTLENLSHPNIVSFHGMKTDATKFLLFMEYADYGSLRIFYKNYGYLSITESLYCVQQIVKGLEYLHEKGVAHRDIKCANCLIFHQNYLIKLADFGASKRIEHESIISGLKGTPQWMAPEVIKGTQKADGWIKADIWSLGCTIVEMITAKLPYAQYNNPMTAMYRIASGEIPQIDSERLSYVVKKAASSSSPRPQLQPQDQRMVDFIHQCCTVDPLRRPSVTQLKSLPWLQMAETSTSEIPIRLFTHPAPVTMITTQSMNTAASFLSNQQKNHKKVHKKSASSSFDPQDDNDIDLGIEVDEEVEDEDDALAHSYRSPTKKNTSSSSASASSLPTANRTYRYQKSDAQQHPSQKGKVDWEQAFDCDESVASEMSERTVERHNQQKSHHKKPHQGKKIDRYTTNFANPSEEEYYMDEEVVEDDDDDEHFYQDDFEGDEQHQHLPHHEHYRQLNDANNDHGDHYSHDNYTNSNNNENNISQLTGFGEEENGDPEDFEVLYEQQQQQIQQYQVSHPSSSLVEQSLSNLSAVSAPAAIHYQSSVKTQSQSHSQHPASYRSKLAAKMDSEEIGALYSDPAYATIQLDPSQLLQKPQHQQPNKSHHPSHAQQAILEAMPINNITPTTQVRKIQKNPIPIVTRRAPSTAEGIPSSQKASVVSSSVQQSSKSQGKLITMKSHQQGQAQAQAHGLKPGAMRLVQRNINNQNMHEDSRHNSGASNNHASVMVRKVVAQKAVSHTKHSVTPQNNSNNNNNSNQGGNPRLRTRSAGVYLSPVAAQKQGNSNHHGGPNTTTASSSPPQHPQHGQHDGGVGGGRRMEVLPEERVVRTAPAVPGSSNLGGPLAVVTEGKHVAGQNGLSSLSANAKKAGSHNGGAAKKQRLSLGPSHK